MSSEKLIRYFEGIAEQLEDSPESLIVILEEAQRNQLMKEDSSDEIVSYLENKIEVLKEEDS